MGLSRQSEFINLTPTQPAEPAQNNPATGTPTISGTLQVGETLTADTSGIADADGLDKYTFSLSVAVRRRGHRGGYCIDLPIRA